MKKIIEILIKKYKAYKAKMIRLRAEERYQVTEYGGLLWVTCDGVLAASENMLSDTVVATVMKMREVYIECHTNN